MATASTGYVLFDEFVPEILQYTPGAPPIMVRIHIRNSVIHFLERSMILIKSPATFCLDADEYIYTLKYPSNRYRAVAIKGDTRIGEDASSAKKLTITTRHQLASWNSGSWATDTASYPTMCFLTEETNKLRVYPIPTADSDDDLYISTAVTIRRDQTEVDEWVWEKWEEPIQAGALSSLLSIRSASWADRRLALDFSRSYKMGLRRARAVALRGTGEFSGRVVPQNFEVMGANGIRSRGEIWD